MYTKIDKDNFKRIIKADKEDNFNKPNLEKKRDVLISKINPLQEQLDEINNILKEIKKVE